VAISDAQEFGSQVRKARLQSGLTQAGLAQRCGTTQSWISELENGKPRAELELALRVFRELGLALEVASPGATIKAPRSASGFDVADLVNMPRPPETDSGNDD